MNKLTDKIQFNAKKHKYTLGRGKDKIEFQGVTSWIAQFFSKFDAKAQARISNKNPNSKYYRMGVRNILKQWEEARDEGAGEGTEIHKQIETALMKHATNTLDVQEEMLLSPKTMSALMFYEQWLRNHPSENLHQEQVVFSKELKLAGTIDLLITTEKGTVIIVDWKTNKEIKSEGYQGATGKGPCSDMSDSTLSKYNLQLSTYAYILEKEYGFQIEKLYLVHLQTDAYDMKEIVYNKQKIEEMLKWTGLD